MQHFRQVKLLRDWDGHFIATSAVPGEADIVEWQPLLDEVSTGAYWRFRYNGKWDVRYKPKGLDEGLKAFLVGGELMFLCDESVAEWDAEVKEAYATF